MSNQASIGEIKKMSFTEFRKKYPPKCKKCEVELDIPSMRRIFDVNGERVRGLYCPSCFEDVQMELVRSRFVELYKEVNIYLKDGRYFASWNTSLCYPTIEDCRKRIDLGRKSLFEIILEAKNGER